MRRSVLSVLLATLLSAAPASAGEQRVVEVIVGAGRVEFRAGGEVVSRYHTGQEAAKPYFWPVNAVGGLPVTRGWPLEKSAGSQDHPHQRSLWFGHGDVNGVDFWAEGKGRGRIVCIKVGVPHANMEHGWVTTRNEWRGPDGRKILDETRVIHLYDHGQARLLVLDIDLEASAGPVVFGDTKEGTLGVRVADSIAWRGGGEIRNAEGKTGEWACWGQRAAWCDCFGAGRGVALFDDPGNRPPACWHCRGYGLLAANPFGRERSGFPAMKGHTDLVRLVKGEHLRLRYGVFVHPAGADLRGESERFVKIKGINSP